MSLQSASSKFGSGMVPTQIKGSLPRCQGAVGFNTDSGRLLYLSVMYCGSYFGNFMVGDIRGDPF